MLVNEIVSNGPQFFYLVPWVVFFPVLGLLFNVVFGRRVSEKVSGGVASFASGMTFVVMLLLAYSLFGHPEGAVVPLLDWIHIGDLQVSWAFQVDTLSVTMMFVVSLVGTLIHIYAIGYMHEDVQHNGDPGRYSRFFIFMNLFIAAMMVLVSSDNYLMLFVGWEGVGLCSYLLIGFWYDKGKDGIGNALAAKKAFVANRVGDFGFLLALFTTFWVFGTFNFHEIFEQVPAVAAASPAVIALITLFMLVGVTGKSAQIPLYVWLPDAMAGPTPVSALIHAATMVTAGVYLITRSNVLYSSVPQVQTFVAILGASTALFAATIAVGQFDIKKVLAYSTISQLGFMVAAVGMGGYVAGMFHLVAHAFFKSLLFLSAGSVIQGVERGIHHVEHDKNLKQGIDEHDIHVDPQDMRNMGGLRKQMKITFWVYLIGAIALAGIPVLAGFWSKDEILKDAHDMQPVAYWLLSLAAFLTAFYMGRQIFMVFFGKPRTLGAEHAKESPPIMTIPLMVLAGLATLGGLLNLPGSEFLTKWEEETISSIHPTGFSLQVAAISSILAVLAVFLAWWIYYKKYQKLQAATSERYPADPLRKALGPVFTAINHAWWVDELYWTVILNPYVSLSYFLADVVDWQFLHDWLNEKVIAGGFNKITKFTANVIDLGWIDGVSKVLSKLVETTAEKWRWIESGYVRSYALMIFVGVVIIIGFVIFI